MSDIEYFLSGHSAFAYLGSTRLTMIAEAAGASILYRPMDLNRVVEVVSFVPFSQRNTEHRNYFFKREIDRWSQIRDAPVLGFRPTYHDNDTRLSNGMLIAGLQQGVSIHDLVHAMLEGHWRYDVDLADRQTLVRLAGEVGIDPEPLLAAAMSEETQAIYEANTREAIERSVFGSPTYFVDGDMFYGQDHLEMVESALKKPFAGAWPV